MSVAVPSSVMLPAELDEREDHELAEDRPAGERIADDQTRHAGCTR